MYINVIHPFNSRPESTGGTAGCSSAICQEKWLYLEHRKTSHKRICQTELPPDWEPGIMKTSYRAESHGPAKTEHTRTHNPPQMPRPIPHHQITPCIPLPPLNAAVHMSYATRASNEKCMHSACYCDAIHMGRHGREASHLERTEGYKANRGAANGDCMRAVPASIRTFQSLIVVWGARRGEEEWGSPDPRARRKQMNGHTEVHTPHDLARSVQDPASN